MERTERHMAFTREGNVMLGTMGREGERAVDFLIRMSVSALHPFTEWDDAPQTGLEAWVDLPNGQSVRFHKLARFEEAES